MQNTHTEKDIICHLIFLKIVHIYNFVVCNLRLTNFLYIFFYLLKITLNLKTTLGIKKIIYWFFLSTPTLIFVDDKLITNTSLITHLNYYNIITITHSHIIACYIEIFVFKRKSLLTKMKDKL